MWSLGLWLVYFVYFGREEEIGRLYGSGKLLRDVVGCEKGVLRVRRFGLRFF